MDIHVHPNKSACGHQSVSIRVIRMNIINNQKLALA